MREHGYLEFPLADLSESERAYYESRALRAGRSMPEQLVYELEALQGLRPPDVGDSEMSWRGAMFQRVLSRKLLWG